MTDMEKKFKDYEVSARQPHLVSYPTQQHIFKQLTVLANGIQYVPIDVSFFVKRVKINFAYNFKADDTISMDVVSDLVDGQIVGCLNKFNFVDPADNTKYYFADSFDDNKSFIYVFKEPKKLSGTYKFTFTNAFNANITTGNVVVHIELIDQ